MCCCCLLLRLQAACIPVLPCFLLLKLCKHRGSSSLLLLLLLQPGLGPPCRHDCLAPRRRVATCRDRAGAVQGVDALHLLLLLLLLVVLLLLVCRPASLGRAVLVRT
jgi:hypothetical protein